VASAVQGVTAQFLARAGEGKFEHAGSAAFPGNHRSVEKFCCSCKEACTEGQCSIFQHFHAAYLREFGRFIL
jgi:hypothetical protein